MKELLYRNECYQVVGACFEVAREKGCGFLEAVYQECLELELAAQSIPFEAQCPIPMAYKGRPLHQRYFADLLCFGKIIVELKATSALADQPRAQVLNYLNASGCRLGLLVNFGSHPKLEWERLVV